ncbi:MAG: hypothetical protein FK733_06540 [Asgard group archaeon]|nr:hypothetical protein [Asgard group archaeon]
MVDDQPHLLSSTHDTPLASSEQLLIFDSNWTWDVVPVVIKATTDGPFVEELTENTLVNYTASLLTPWGNSLTLNFTSDYFYLLLELTIPTQSGLGNFVLNASFEYLNEIPSLSSNFYNVYEEKQFQWNLTSAEKQLTEIDWKYIHYSFWGLGPGWHIVVNQNDTYFTYESTFNSFDFSSLDDMRKVPTNQTVWNLLVDFNTQNEVYRWKTLTYDEGPWVICDGPVKNYTGLLSYPSVSYKINSYESYDCDSLTSWVPEEFESLKSLMWSYYLELNNTYPTFPISSFKIVAALSVISSIFIVFIVFRKRKN